jgi:hypothetical protein
MRGAWSCQNASLPLTSQTSKKASPKASARPATLPRYRLAWLPDHGLRQAA